MESISPQKYREQHFKAAEIQSYSWVSIEQTAIYQYLSCHTLIKYIFKDIVVVGNLRPAGVAPAERRRNDHGQSRRAI
jgi:hypothetical protein